MLEDGKSSECIKSICHNPGQGRLELYNLEWYYYQKITTTPHHTTPPPHHHMYLKLFNAVQRRKRSIAVCYQCIPPDQNRICGLGSLPFCLQAEQSGCPNYSQARGIQDNVNTRNFPLTEHVQCPVFVCIKHLAIQVV